MFNRFSYILYFLLLAFSSCEQSDPPSSNANEESGDISFSGYNWKIKESNGGLMGPGLNYFSKNSGNVWLDQNGCLHLKIRKDGNRWLCSEVISTKEFGYGTYVFTLASDVSTLNEKVVFGLFSWSDYTFTEAANSEVDIEFSKWNNPYDTFLLTYSVQPVWFDNPSPYVERTRRPSVPRRYLRTTSTHIFNWTPDTIKWNSYDGDYPTVGSPWASWSFDKSNPARQKLEGGRTSQAVVIPSPYTTTNARMNLWLLGGLPPSDSAEAEVIVKRFEFIPR